MSTQQFGISQPVRRREDVRLLTGGGRYTDDVSLPGQVYACFVRSPVARGTIVSIDADAARSAPGVLAVYTGEDLRAGGVGNIPCMTPFKSFDGTPIRSTPRPAIAVGTVQHLGVPVAVVVAETVAQAADAAELVDVDIDALPAVIDPEAALADDAPQLYDDIPNNVVLDFRVGDPDAVEAAFAKAAHITRLRTENNRLVAASMEPRQCLARWDHEHDRYELIAGSQGVNAVRRILAEFIFNVPNEKMHVLSGDVGGGFGMKTQPYPEYVACLFAARELGRPVKWQGTRSEGFLSDNQARDGVLNGEMAFDKDGHILALRADLVAGMGGYLSSHGPAAATTNVCNCLTGPYRTPVLAYRARLVLNNAAPIGPYRGAGRPEAAYIVERLLDAAAREMGIDRIELRRRNMIAPGEMPYTTPLKQSYDSGDFPGAMADALKLADWDGFEARRTAAAARGKLRGIGLASFVEIAGGALAEGAKVAITPAGKVEVRLAMQSNGQGHVTSFAQLVADQLQVPYEAVEIIQGDSDETPEPSFAAVASRSMAIGGSAVMVTCDKVIENGKQLAGHVLEAAAADIEFRDGAFRVAGTDKAIGLLELAGRTASLSVLPEGVPNKLDAYESFTSPEQTFPNGCHVCEVEIDPETGVVEVVDYIAVDDCGTVVNPMIVHGQVHGGVAQGLGQVLGEHAVYDDDGQLLSGTFMDYPMPHADNMPMLKLGFHSTRCTTNPLGAKGAGEAGTTGALPAAMNAIIHALEPRGITSFDMPATPLKIWTALHAG
jgi:carbon-monoxide dehydrogenase large subunit